MKKLRLISTIILFTVFSIIFNITAFAITTSELIDDTKSKSLTINFCVQESGIDVPIEGAEIGIVKIANFIDNKYIPIAELSDQINVDLNTLSEEDFIDLANQLEIDPQNTQITATNGKAYFDIIDNGLYLISEISATNMAADYQIINPYIISIPYLNTNGSWEYNVIAKPKTSIIKLDVSTPESIPESKPESKVESIPSSKPESKPESKLESKNESVPVTSSPNISLVQTGAIQYIINFVIILIISSLIMILFKDRGDTK